MPAAKLRPVGPSTTTRPPVMYSQPWSPTPSTTAVALEGRLGHADQLLVERELEAVVLRTGLVQRLAVVGVVGHGQDRRQVQSARLPVVDCRLHVERLGVPDG